MIGYIVLVCSKKGRPPISTRTDTRVPYATLFRSVSFRLTLLMRWRFNGSITFTPASSEQRRFRCRVGGNGQHIDLHPRTGPQPDRKSTRLNSSHQCASRMPSSARKKKTQKQHEEP